MIGIERGHNAETNYQIMVAVVKDILECERDVVANLANISAVINVYMERISWVGFYIFKDGELVLGPFQGKPACVRIKKGKGVCGKAAQDNAVVIVENVHEFSGHIACDPDTNSEIVLPISRNNELFGVLDLDSIDYGRFTELECTYLLQICWLIESSF